MYDFLFELTEFSDNEGEQILVEAADIQEAWEILTEYFDEKAFRFIERMSVEEGEMLGLDTY